MTRFLMGIVIGIIGLIIWVWASFARAKATTFYGNEQATVEMALMITGFCLMGVGPLFFWLALPIYRWITSPSPDDD